MNLVCQLRSPFSHSSCWLLKQESKSLKVSPSPTLQCSSTSLLHCFPNLFTHHSHSSTQPPALHLHVRYLLLLFRHDAFFSFSAFFHQHTFILPLPLPSSSSSSSSNEPSIRSRPIHVRTTADRAYPLDTDLPSNALSDSFKEIASEGNQFVSPHWSNILMQSQDTPSAVVSCASSMFSNRSSQCHILTW